MRLIEAIKSLRLQSKILEQIRSEIANHSQVYSNEKSPLGDTDEAKEVIRQKVQSYHDRLREIERLSRDLAFTNATTEVTIRLDGQDVTKTITEWIKRRDRTVIDDTMLQQSLGARQLKPKVDPNLPEDRRQIEVINLFDVKQRDSRLRALMEERSLIDGALEIVNATTDLRTMKPEEGK